jgi:hypothetical protein
VVWRAGFYYFGISFDTTVAACLCGRSNIGSEPIKRPAMKKPSILSTFFDAEHNMTYRVFAFRKLTELEMVQAVKLYLAQPKILRLKTRERNKTVSTDSLQGSEIDFAVAL